MTLCRPRLWVRSGEEIVAYKDACSFMIIIFVIYDCSFLKMDIYMEEQTLPLVMLGVLAIQNGLKKKMKKRSTWSKQWLQNRENYSHMTLLRELQENNPDDFRNYLRMNDECFQALLQLVTPVIKKQITIMRQPISPEQRLVATLRYLATGRSLQDLKFSTGISPQSLGRIIPETCKSIIDALQTNYVKVNYVKLPILTN